jgi:hypothetical protein
MIRPLQRASGGPMMFLACCCDSPNRCRHRFSGHSCFFDPHQLAARARHRNIGDDCSLRPGNVIKVKAVIAIPGSPG